MKFLRQLLTLSTFQIVNLGLTLLSRIVLARVLVEAAFGAFGAALNATVVLSRILSFGLAPANQFYASKKQFDRGMVIATGAILALASSLIATGIAYALVPVVNSTLLGNHPNSQAMLNSFLPCLPVVILAMNLGVMLIPLGEVRAFGILQVLTGSAFILPFFIFRAFMPGADAAVWAQCSVWVFSLSYLVWKLSPFLSGLKWDKPLAKEMLVYGWKSWPNVILNIGLARVATLLGALYLSPRDLSIFVLAVNIVEGLTAPHSSLGQLVMTKSASDPEQFGRNLLKALRLSCLMLAGLTAALVLGGYFLIPILFGHGFKESYYVTLIVVLTAIAHIQLRTMSSYFAGLERPQLTTRALAIEMVLMLGLLPTLGSQFGLYGVAVASALSAVGSWAAAGWFLRRLIRAPIRDQLWPKKGDYVWMRSLLSSARQDKQSVA